MLEKDPKAFSVFEKWKSAPANAFGSKNKSGVIPEEDKARYGLIFDELMQAAEFAKSTLVHPETVEVKSMNFSYEYGSRGHRPVDVWVSICASGSDAFAKMPQVYLIASERGLEIGFAVSISEDDYHDPAVKSRNRTIVPLINRKLPEAENDRTLKLARSLEKEGGWFYNTKARLQSNAEGFSAWPTLQDMVKAIKSDGSVKGGGSICKFYSIDEIANLNLFEVYSRVLHSFYPLMMDCLPSSWDKSVVNSHFAADKIAETIAFDPADVNDARQRVLRQIAERRGQGQFRSSLMKAYRGKCAISKTPVEAVLEAAHITPYLGHETNHISNGILLRADLHTLFDLFLIKIDPETLQVKVSASLKATPYQRLEGRKLSLPKNKNDWPSPMALQQHYSQE